MNKKVIMGIVGGMIVTFMALYFIGASDETDPKTVAKPAASQAPAVTKPPASQVATKPSASPTPVASKPAAAPTSQVAVKDPRRYLTVEDMVNITGTRFSLSYVDMKNNGKPDMTFSTTDEGHVALSVTILPASYYESFYSKFRSQDYKAMGSAFWGPKNENPPRMLGFRKGDTTIFLMRYVDDGQYYVSIEMMERIASTIAARL